MIVIDSASENDCSDPDAYDQGSRELEQHVVADIDCVDMAEGVPRNALPL